jgi:lambda repressor-like predicted transcriptional regulator
MMGHQLWILNGMNQTYDQGESLIATIEEVDIKQIAAQTNGYVDLRFTPSSGNIIRERLTLSVQLAADVLESEVVAIRYLPSSSKSIVMTTTYDLHKRVIYSNLAMMGFSLLAVLVIAVGGTFFARRKEQALEFTEATEA